MVNDDLKIFHPTEIQETPFPGEPEPVALAGQPSPAGTFSPTQTKEKTFPRKRTAVELLSTALNTRSRKILEEFELQQSGGLKIGDFKEGISGDLRITPNGLTARNIAGLTTFAIDGTTGDAVFKGEIRAGSIMTEGEIVNSNGEIIADANGLVSNVNFKFDSVNATDEVSTTSVTFVDVTNMSITFNLNRAASLFISFTAKILANPTAPNQTWGAELQLVIDSVAQVPILRGAVAYAGTTGLDIAVDQMLSYSGIYSFTEGSHTIKLQWRNTQGAGLDQFMTNRNLLYLRLGV